MFKFTRIMKILKIHKFRNLSLLSFSAVQLRSREVLKSNFRIIVQVCHASDLPDPTLKAMHQLYIPISLYFLLYLFVLIVDFLYFDEGFFLTFRGVYLYLYMGNRNQIRVLFQMQRSRIVCLICRYFGCQKKFTKGL